MEKIWNDIVQFFNTSGWKIAVGLCILIVGGIIIHYLCKGLARLLYKTPIDNAVISFIVSLVKIIVWIALIFMCAGIMELSTSSLLVCLSSIALAVGLALKDSFANLTNGVFIIYNKPFKRGDYIAIDGVEGKVQNIKLLSTELITFDNRKLVVPNSKFTNETIVNYSALPTRRIEQVFSVAYGEDMNLVEKTLKTVIQNHRCVLTYPEVIVYITKHNASSVDFMVKAWTNTEDYWTVYNELPKIVYNAFEKSGISIPFNQLDVHVDYPVVKDKTVLDKVSVKNKKTESIEKSIKVDKNKETAAKTLTVGKIEKPVKVVKPVKVENLVKTAKPVKAVNVEKKAVKKIVKEKQISKEVKPLSKKSEVKKNAK